MPDKNIEQSLNAKGSASYKAVVDGDIIDGTVVVINKKTRYNHLDLLFVKKTIFKATEFTFEEIVNYCNLTKNETLSALNLLKNAGINKVYTDATSQNEKYIFIILKALYAHAIYKPATLFC